LPKYFNRRPTSLTGSTRDSLAHAKSVPAQSLLYDKLDKVLQLYGSDSIEDVLTGIARRKRRLNRLVELQSKVARSVHELGRTKRLILSVVRRSNHAERARANKNQ